MKEKTPTIKKIDAEVVKVGMKNGLSVKEIGFTQDILQGKTQTEAYKNNIAKPTTTDRKAIDCKASEKIRNVKVQDTIKDVLISNKITKDSVIKTHQLILNKSIDINQLSVAEKANTKFMQLLGMEEIQPSNQTNIQINIDSLSKEDIDNKLKDIITV